VLLGSLGVWGDFSCVNHTTSSISNRGTTCSQCFRWYRTGWARNYFALAGKVSTRPIYIRESNIQQGAIITNYELDLNWGY
jgi:hypothetical protein